MSQINTENDKKKFSILNIFMQFFIKVSIDFVD